MWKNLQIIRHSHAVPFDEFSFDVAGEGLSIESCKSWNERKEIHKWIILTFLFLKPLKLSNRKHLFSYLYLIFLKELLSIVHHKIHYVITKHMEGHWPAKVTLHHLKYLPWNVPYIRNNFFLKYWQLFLILTCAVHIFDHFPRTNTSGH